MVGPRITSADLLNVPESTVDSAVIVEPMVPRREGLRSNREQPGTYSRREYGFHMTALQAEEKLGRVATESLIAEVKQLMSRNTWHPVHVSELSYSDKKKIIPSKMFVKEKFTARGLFDKVKSRLVAGGHRQDKRLYKDKTSSPTVATTCVLTVAVMAHTDKRKTATIDFPGAYLNSRMPEDGVQRVRMRLNKEIAAIAVQLDESYVDFLESAGTLVVELDGALYGLLEAAKLWYELLCKGLSKLGYAKNPYDNCVFNRIESDGTQSTLAVHVDDMLVTASADKHLDKIIVDIESIFGSISVNRGDIHDYLGMVFDFSDPNRLCVSMDKYVTDLLEGCDVEGTAKSPASDNLFVIDEKSVLLSNDDKEYFHSMVAKILYLAKRVRPDVLVSVSFLTSRVQSPTQNDMDKLVRLLKYLNGTKHLKLYLTGEVLNITAFIDASYGVHSDYKSHSGICISFGKGVVYAKSTKQKLNSKSSTEAEMIAVSDGLGHVLWLRNFLLCQGYDLPPATIFQDNQSAISLFANGKCSSSLRTRHIAIRFYFVKDRVEQKEVKIEFLGTDSMVADLLTKPLQGAKFVKMRVAMMGN